MQIVAGTPPSDPETAEQFFKWLDDVHVPHAFEAFRGVKKAMNYRLIPQSTEFPKTDAEYQIYISVFEYYSAQEYDDLITTLKSKEPVPDALNELPPKYYPTRNGDDEYDTANGCGRGVRSVRRHHVVGPEPLPLLFGWYGRCLDDCERSDVRGGASLWSGCASSLLRLLACVFLRRAAHRPAVVEEWEPVAVLLEP